MDPKATGSTAAAPTAAEKQDDFDGAFAEAIASDMPAPAATEVPAAAGTVTDPVATTTVADPAAAAEGEKPAVVADVDADAAVVVEDDKPAGTEEDPETKIARLERELVEAKTKPAEPDPKPAAAEADPKPAAAAAAPAEPAWYKPSADEQAVLEHHAQAWPDISKAEELRTKIAVYNAVQYVFTKMHEVYGPTLQRFSEMSDTIAEQLTLGALRGEHEDYDEVYAKVKDWVGTLPGAFKQGAERVMREGSPEEVSELISTYKAQQPAAGAKPNAATSATTVAPAATRTTELSATAKKAAQGLTVVGSKRTSPVAPADANDFDGAWKEAIGQ